jgi:type I restriction enzyme M protein
MDASQIGKRAWSYAGVLQDAGLSCFEYVEQLTLLLFLKMADQLTEEPYNRAPIVPPELGWKALLPLMARRWRISTARAWKSSA